MVIVSTGKLRLPDRLSKDYSTSNHMPDIIQNNYADITALNRLYITEGSPELWNGIKNCHPIILTD
ncbi:MAG: hypothetical protein ABI813_01900 [Bacteroidota bacterium]